MIPISMIGWADCPREAHVAARRRAAGMAAFIADALALLWADRRGCLFTFETLRRGFRYV